MRENARPIKGLILSLMHLHRGERRGRLMLMSSISGQEWKVGLRAVYCECIFGSFGMSEARGRKKDLVITQTYSSEGKRTPRGTHSPCSYFCWKSEFLFSCSSALVPESLNMVLTSLCL